MIWSPNISFTSTPVEKNIALLFCGCAIIILNFTLIKLTTMATIRFHIDTKEHIITLTNIKMNQNGFSYNGVTFTKIDDNMVTVKYNKDTTEDTRLGIDCNLTWGLNSIIKVLSKYNKKGCNPYKDNYKMFEFDF